MQIEWFDYKPSPYSLFYGEQFIFTICQYRHRYEYEYVVDFDIDEFFTFGPEGGHYKDMPSFFDSYFGKNAATLGVYQVRFQRLSPTAIKGYC